MRKIVWIVGLILSSTFVYGQQDAMVSQYVFNGLLLNPGYAGSHSYYNSTFIHRNQWVKLDGAPQTNMLAVEGPLRKETMGVGLFFSHDEIGVTKQTDIYAYYAYHLKLSENSKLSFGVRAGTSRYTARLSELTVWDNDNVFAYDQSGRYIPKLGFGLYYYTPVTFAGFSAPTIASFEGKDSNNKELASQLRRHYYLNAGHVFSITNSSVKLKPSFLLKYHPAAPMEADINCHALFNNVLWLGLGYRTGDAIVGMIEFQMGNQVRIGYAYDYTTSMLSSYSAGTHEVLLAYDFYKEKIKTKTPRFF